MKTKDFRIGNLVHFGNMICKVIEITTIHFYVMDFKGENYKNTWADLAPIPLDEEWFLKCKSNSFFNNGFEYKKTSTGRFEVYAGFSLITVIEFVHELQNLNFALLGEEVVFENY